MEYYLIINGSDFKVMGIKEGEQLPEGEAIPITAEEFAKYQACAVAGVVVQLLDDPKPSDGLWGCLMAYEADEPYLRLHDDTFEFIRPDLEHIKDSDIKLERGDLEEFFTRQGQGEQFRIKSVPVPEEGLWGCVELFEPEPMSHIPSATEIVAETMQAMSSEITSRLMAADIPIININTPTDFEVGRFYLAGDQCLYDGNTYQCVQMHAAQTDWTPDKVPALWLKLDDLEEEWPDWEQPVGGHKTYGIGDKVAHNNKKWVSTYEANVWEPGVFGWNEWIEEAI